MNNADDHNKGRRLETGHKRLRILSNEEIEAIYGLPRFTDEERVANFSLTEAEVELVRSIPQLKTRAYCVLQLGYFKAKRRFFAFEFGDVESDLRYIEKHQIQARVRRSGPPVTKVTRIKQQRMVLALFHYRSCNEKERQKLMDKARQLATIISKPAYIFRELLTHLAEIRVVVPGYTTMQKIIGDALNSEQNRLIELLQKTLSQSDVAALDKLIEDSPGLYEITQLKREPKDFGVHEIKNEIRRGDRIRDLYQRTVDLIPTLGISNESTKHYASLVGYYSVYKLKRMNRWVAYLYLLCFIHYRFQRFHDNLIGTLLYDVRNYEDETKDAAKKRLQELRLECNKNMEKAGLVLGIFNDRSIAPKTPFRVVQSKAFSILDREKLATVATHIATSARFDESGFRWERVDQLARQFKIHLRPILTAVELSSLRQNDPLMKAVEFLKTAFAKGKPLAQYTSDEFPVRFLPDNAKRHIYLQEPDETDRRVLVDRYEFCVYKQLSERVVSGEISCRDSARFRSLEDDLIDVDFWRENRESLIEKANLARLKSPIESHLDELEKELEGLIVDVNRRIASGENDHIEIKNKRGAKGRWVLQYPDTEGSVNHGLFDSLGQIDIASVLHYVHKRCRYMDAFEHVLGRYTKQEADDTRLIACQVAWATNLGLGPMGEISNISYNELSDASESFIRLETLKGANDRVSNATAELPVFRHYDIGGMLHSSSDGQKFETRIDTINSRHSPKYFGLKKGVVSYSMVVNHVPINATIIGANEHESHYVFDIIANNTTDIDIERHSTDSHGANQVNSALLYQFGSLFAPRYKRIRDKVNRSLCGFLPLASYNGLIKPTKRVAKDLIISEWPNIERILLSLANKTTTQSIIVGKLSSHARKSRTKRALWAYDNIIESIYLLNYIDSPVLRRNVQHSLNRCESYHKLRRAISFAGFGKLQFKTEREQQIWGECARLLANCIVYFNASILSEMLLQKDREGDIEWVERLIRLSPVAWRHINFNGRYQFITQPEILEIHDIVQAILAGGTIEQRLNVSVG